MNLCLSVYTGNPIFKSSWFETIDQLLTSKFTGPTDCTMGMVLSQLFATVLIKSSPLWSRLKLRSTPSPAKDATTGRHTVALFATKEAIVKFIVVDQSTKVRS